MYKERGGEVVRNHGSSPTAKAACLVAAALGSQR